MRNCFTVVMFQKEDLFHRLSCLAKHRDSPGQSQIEQLVQAGCTPRFCATRVLLYIPRSTRDYIAGKICLQAQCQTALEKFLACNVGHQG